MSTLSQHPAAIPFKELTFSSRHKTSRTTPRQKLAGTLLGDTVPGDEPDDSLRPGSQDAGTVKIKEAFSTLRHTLHLHTLVTHFLFFTTHCNTTYFSSSLNILQPRTLLVFFTTLCNATYFSLSCDT